MDSGRLLLVLEPYLRTLPLDALLWIMLGIALCIQGVFACALLLFGFSTSVVATTCVGIYLYLRGTVLYDVVKIRDTMGLPYPKSLRLGGLQQALIVVSEYIVLILLYTIIQPLDRFVAPILEYWMSRPRSQEQKKRQAYPVLLIHGFFCNTLFWLPSIVYLKFCGFGDVYLITLSPTLGDITLFSKDLEKKVDTILRATGEKKLIIVGHSMGGLVARHYIHSTGKAEKVAKIIALGSPHHGTKVAKSNKSHLLKCKCIEQMACSSSFLEELNQQEEHGSVPITNIYSYDDEIVVPQNSSHLSVKHATNIPCSGVGHLCMPYSPMMNRLMVKEIHQVGQEELCLNREKN